MEKKGKRMETTGNVLPEPIIQHIQSFLNGKEAARTALLSKPWHTAWLTRPTLGFDEGDFKNLPDFEEFTTKTIQRYQDLNLNIQSFRLRKTSYSLSHLAHTLIVNAVKIGAADLELELPNLFIFPREVLVSKRIVRLCLSGGEIKRKYVPCCSRLKSLSVDRVTMKSGTAEAIRNFISSCRASIEEFSWSMSWCSRFNTFSSPYELHKLKRLFLESVLVDNTFFNDFASKFPCLKDLSLVRCSGHRRIELASTSLEWIRLVQREKRRLMDKFDVPNIRKFTYSGGESVPSLSINEGRSSTREWEFDISVERFGLPVASWYLKLRRLLKKIRLSRITISLSLNNWTTRNKVQDDEFYKSFRVEPKRVPVESLVFVGLSEFCSVTLLRLLGICCPKLITHDWLPESSTCAGWKVNNEALGLLCNELMMMSANQNTFGLNYEVKVEICEEIDKDHEWRPLLLKGPFDASKPPANKCKVSFRLTWG